MQDQQAAKLDCHQRDDLALIGMLSRQVPSADEATTMSNVELTRVSGDTHC